MAEVSLNKTTKEGNKTEFLKHKSNNFHSFQKIQQ